MKHTKWSRRRLSRIAGLFERLINYPLDIPEGWQLLTSKQIEVERKSRQLIFDTSCYWGGFHRLPVRSPRFLSRDVNGQNSGASFLEMHGLTHEISHRANCLLVWTYHVKRTNDEGTKNRFDTKNWHRYAVLKLECHKNWKGIKYRFNWWQLTWTFHKCVRLD